MVKCARCGRSIEEKNALKHKGEDGEYEVICQDCFREATGVNYQTFAYRRENAKMMLIAVLFCLAATVYAFVTKGILYGSLGIVLTILVYLFATKKR